MIRGRIVFGSGKIGRVRNRIAPGKRLGPDGANHHEVGASAPRVKVIHEPVESVNSLALHEAAFDGKCLVIVYYT